MAEKPPMTVKPETVIAWPTDAVAETIASRVLIPRCNSSRYRSRIKMVNSVPIPRTSELRAIVTGL